MKNFEELKEKILTAAKAASACTEQYKRAYGTNSMVELCNVVKDNFHWCCSRGVLTGELIDEYKSDFSTNGIFHNENCDRAYLLATGNSTVRAYGNSTVKANGNSTVRAYDNSYINSYSAIECKINKNAILRYNGVVYCCGQQIKTN